MQKIFSHENRLMVFNIRNLLTEAGIDCHIRNEFSGGGVGDLSPFETWPEVWVADEDEDVARRVVAVSLEHAGGDADWICRHCGETNAGNFEICWHCMSHAE
jgi:hypothetical protein